MICNHNKRNSLHHPNRDNKSSSYKEPLSTTEVHKRDISVEQLDQTKHSSSISIVKSNVSSCTNASSHFKQPSAPNIKQSSSTSKTKNSNCAEITNKTVANRNFQVNLK